MGTASLAVGAERRREGLKHRLAESDAADFGRQISSVFAELSLPLLGTADEPRSPPRVELSLAGRYENYSDFGNTFNPKVGLRWIPLQWLKLRTSWGTSFRAPKLLDLYDNSQDKRRDPAIFPGSSSGQRTIRGSGAAGRKSQTRRKKPPYTWTAGLDFTPALPGLALSLTYFDIDYQDRILVPGPPSPFEILFEESQWAEVITRNPGDEQISCDLQQPRIHPEYGGDMRRQALRP